MARARVTIDLEADVGTLAMCLHVLSAVWPKVQEKAAVIDLTLPGFTVEGPD